MKKIFVLILTAMFALSMSVPAAASDPIADALRADAVAYWTMDEIDGTRVDATGRGNDLSPNNSPESAAGKVGNAVSFPLEGTSYLSCPATDDLSIQSDIRYFAFWVYIVSGEFGEFFTLSSADFEFGSYYGGIYLIVGDAGYAEVSMLVNADAWYFVEAYVDNSDGTVAIAVGGGDFVTYDPVEEYPAMPTTFKVGALTDTIFTMPGRIDELGIYNRILTADERAYLYNSGNGRTLYP